MASGMTGLTCPRCDGTRWVCENHPDRPWEGRRACPCGGAGMPCPDCNPSDEETPPAMPPDFVEDGEEPTRH